MLGRRRGGGQGFAVYAARPCGPGGVLPAVLWQTLARPLWDQRGPCGMHRADAGGRGGRPSLCVGGHWLQLLPPSAGAAWGGPRPLQGLQRGGPSHGLGSHRGPSHGPGSHHGSRAEGKAAPGKGSEALGALQPYTCSQGDANPPVQTWLFRKSQNNLGTSKTKWTQGWTTPRYTREGMGQRHTVAGKCHCAKGGFQKVPRALADTHRDGLWHLGQPGQSTPRAHSSGQHAAPT